MPLNLNNSQFLTESEIREKASSIFTAQGAPDTSEKYSHIPTNRIIQDMEALGWGVVDAKQVRARKGEGFQKHLVVFRNNDLFIEGEDGDDVFPQILLTNSHDGKNSFTFTAGLFRMVCENGLVISTQEFENMRIRHFGYDFEKLQQVITSMVEVLPLTVESMNRFKQTQLGQDQMLDFARRALEVRFGAEQTQNITIDYMDLVAPTREEDAGNDLWSVFNVVQEKLMHGMFNYQTGTKMRKARKIKNFKQDIELNTKLFELANEYAVN
jgi:hypothetical protein